MENQIDEQHLVDLVRGAFRNPNWIVNTALDSVASHESAAAREGQVAAFDLEMAARSVPG